nr:unnamed protein product [Digitaria exilis]
MSAQKPAPPATSGAEPEGKESRTALERAADAADELYRLRDTFFPRDPAEKAAALRAGADAALALLDAIPPEERKSPQQRGVFEFLRGKILDVFPDYHKEAEDHLSKAVKLNPSLVDAWLCLGNCIWKKGDLSAAKNCFSLALSKGSDKKILCQLSMLERSMAQGSEDQELLVEESINHAKEAVVLDIKDGNSWYNMGNAYLTSFFVGGAWDHTKLHHSVKAYQNAEKDKTMSLNPDLYYNCATADKYLENYERALRGFEAAALKDPGLGADTEVEKIISLLDKLENAMKVSKNIKNAPMKVVQRYYLACDLDQSYFMLSVYGLRNDAIKEGDRVVLFEPHYRILDASWKDKRYQFKSIRVDFPEQILINEKAPAPRHVARASIHAHNKP